MGRTRKAAARLVTGKAADQTLRDPHAPGRGVPRDGDAARDGHEQREAEPDVCTTPDWDGARHRNEGEDEESGLRPIRSSRDIAAGGPRGVTGRSRAMTPR